MPIAQDARKKPASIKVHVSAGEGVEIPGSAQHTSRYDFPYLRDHCPCALCNDEREKKAKGGASPRSPLLAMYKPRVTAKSANAVGTYAVQIQFSDSHATAIFSFEHLREICPCPACERDFRAAPKESTA